MASTSSSSNLPAHFFVFPALEKEEDFVISNYVADEDGEASNPSAEDEFELPFGTAAKVDRIGRIADWTGLSTELGQQRGGRQRVAITNTQAKAEEEEEGWSLSLSSNQQPSLNGPQRRAPMARPIRGAVSANIASAPAAPSRAATGQRGAARPGRPWNARPFDRIREPSIKAGPEWRIVEEIEFSRLARLQINVEEPRILRAVGSVKTFDRAFDKVKAKAEKALPSISGVAVPTVSPASQDAYMLELAKSGEAAIFTTDAVAALLMACPRTVQPWDLVVRRVGAAIFLDSRPEAKNELVPVNETANDAPTEDAALEAVNNAAALAAEATKVNEALQAMLTKEPAVKLGDEACPVAYRYAKVPLGESLHMVVRTRAGALLPPLDASGSDTMAVIRAFLEFDPKSGGMDWRQRLDAQRGAVLAHEIKNNSAVLARWLYEAILGHADTLKLAYVSRASPKSPLKHGLLAVHEFDPFDLATQMGLNIPNGFGILRAVAEICLALPDSLQYALVRDANKPMLRLYSVPL
jgi:translation initiation factor 3 subunit D